MLASPGYLEGLSRLNDAPEAADISMVNSIWSRDSVANAAPSPLVLSEETSNGFLTRTKILFSGPEAPAHLKYSWPFSCLLSSLILFPEFRNGDYSFTCTSYYAREFHELRLRLGITNFTKSLSRCSTWEASGGKSRAKFFKTAGRPFVSFIPII